MLKLCLLLLLPFLYVSCQSERFSKEQNIQSFHIGNSLTWDMQPAGVAEIALEKGYKAKAGYHITCGKPLTFIIENPKNTCVKPVPGFGYWGDALTGKKLDFVTMQPFRGASTLKSEEDAIINWIELCSKSPGNEETVYYIYASWPAQLDYVKTWISPFPDEDGKATVLCAEYFNHLIKRVRARTDCKVYMIPAGEVLYNLDKELKKGLVPGLEKVQDLFRDKVHLKGDVGRFAVALTAWATIYREDVRNVKKPKKHYGKAAAFSEVYYNLVRKTVAEVIAVNPYTD